MIQVNVAGIALDATGQHVILLRPVPGGGGPVGRVLPIWIGEQEAASILVAVEGVETPRPLAHDLMRALLENLGAEVERVEVTRIDDGTFYAEISLSTPDGDRRVDARPSDAIALASRTGATMWVADAVLDEAGAAEPTVIGAEPDDVATSPEESVDEFRRFLDDVEPDDFRG